MTWQKQRWALGLRRILRCGLPLATVGIIPAAAAALAMADPSAMQQACGLIGARAVGCYLMHGCCAGSDFGNGSTNLNVPAGHTVILTGDRDYHDLTIDNGGTLDTRGYRLRVCGTLLNYGTITVNAGNPGGSGGAGGKGANPKGTGSDPTNCGRTSPNCTPGQPGGLKVGRGGKGGGGGGGGGGAWSDDLVCEFDTDGGNGGNGGHESEDVLIYAYHLSNRGVIHADGYPSGNGPDCNSNGFPDECEAWILADVNLDGLINGRDVQCFVYIMIYPPPNPWLPCCGAAADMNSDGLVDTADIAPFVTALLVGS